MSDAQGAGRMFPGTLGGAVQIVSPFTRHRRRKPPPVSAAVSFYFSNPPSSPKTVGTFDPSGPTFASLHSYDSENPYPGKVVVIGDLAYVGNLFTAVSGLRVVDVTSGADSLLGMTDQGYNNSILWLALGNDGFLYGLERNDPLDALPKIVQIDQSDPGVGGSGPLTVWGTFGSAAHPPSTAEVQYLAVKPDDGSFWSTGDSRYLWHHDSTGAFVAEWDVRADLTGESLGGLQWQDGILYLSRGNTFGRGGFITFDGATFAMPVAHNDADNGSIDVCVAGGRVYATRSTDDMLTWLTDGTAEQSIPLDGVNATDLLTISAFTA